MKRLAALLAVLLAAGCQQAPLPLIVDPPMCRVTPDGAPPWLAGDRGIGGTGAVADRGIGRTGIASDRGIGSTGVEADRGIGGTGIGGTGNVADRGIGGTGIVADRGIGGTGIVGVVSGFGSICVDGLEVAVDPKAPVVIDGAPGSQADLRIGQVVAIPATDRNQAVSIAVRHEVSGPVEAVVSTEPGIVVVAGQRVRVPSSAVGSATIQPGAWVEVSGLRDDDGDIAATRVDPRPPGNVLVRGPLLRLGGQSSIGDMPVTVPAATTAAAGSYVIARGEYADGELRGEVLKPDTLVGNPPAWFGPGTKQLVLAAHTRFEAGNAVLTGGYRVPLASGIPAPVNRPGIVVLYLQAQPGGSFAVTGVAGVRPLAVPPPAASGHATDSNPDPAAAKPAAADPANPPSAASATSATITTASATAEANTDAASTGNAVAAPKAAVVQVDTTVAEATPSAVVTSPPVTTPASAAKVTDPDPSAVGGSVSTASTTSNTNGNTASSANTTTALKPSVSTGGESISTTTALKPGTGTSEDEAGEGRSTERNSKSPGKSFGHSSASLSHPTISRSWADSAAASRVGGAAHAGGSFGSHTAASTSAHAAASSAARGAAKALTKSSVPAFKSLLPRTFR